MGGKQCVVLDVFLAVLIAAITVGCSEPVKSAAEVGGQVSRIKRAYADIPEGQVHYLTQGTGPVLLLIHQSVQSSNEYIKVIPLLAKSYRVIAMDTLGFGQSDKPPRVYQIPDYARSVISFLDALGIEKVNLLGHHTGALIAVEVAATHPERVIKLIVSGLPHYYIQKETDPMPEGFRLMEMKEDGSHLLNSWNSAKDFPMEERYEITLSYLEAGPRGEEGHHAARHYSRLVDDRLRAIKAPTLALSGEEDSTGMQGREYKKGTLVVAESVPRGGWLNKGKLGVEEVAELVPNGKSLILKGKGSGSRITRTMPSEFAEAVLGFLK